MTVEEKLKEQAERLKKIKSWPARLNKLRVRKKDPLKESEFCRRYGIPIANFNRNKNCRRLATAATVEKVEKAFEAEGV